ncbi:MAG: putative PolB exonuclease-like 3'-5' exonuclease [Gammaproteobacteria bacterium]|jgi:predicted PolB exonuclease-like 3'-5' exonuclease
MNVFVFDLETVPDVAAGRRIHGLPDSLSDNSVADAMFAIRRSKVGHDFLPLHLHRIVAISVVLRTADRFKVWSLGEQGATEAELITRFFGGLERFSADLVSWNGGGFDLPVLHYRALLHGIAAPRYWDTGEDDQSMRWNNYLSRFHQRHTDLMDVLAAYQPRANAPLDQIATMCGFPGKLGMSGANVWDAFMDGGIADIRAYCETDVVNTFLLWLRYQLIRGRLLQSAYDQEICAVRAALEKDNASHWQAFLAAWRQQPSV